MIQKLSIILLLFMFLIACKNEKTSEADDQISTLEKAVEQQATGENIASLFSAYDEKIRDKELSRNDLKETLDKAYNLADGQGWGKELIGYAYAYLKEFPGEVGNEEKVLQLINLMEERNQKNTVRTLKYGFLDAYPESIHLDSIHGSLDSTYPNAKAYLQDMALKVFDNPDAIGVNIINAKEYVNSCEAYTLVLPADSLAPRYLFNAAEMSRTVKTFDKTLFLYDWLIAKYPNYEKTPMAMFLKGFILENELNNIDKAKEVYRKFLENYPAHDLADDVQFLYDNLGKSNEEILEMIEKNRQSE